MPYVFRCFFRYAQTPGGQTTLDYIVVYTYGVAVYVSVVVHAVLSASGVIGIV